MKNKSLKRKQVFNIALIIIIFDQLTKLFAIAGLRLGWGYASKQIIDSMYQIKAPFNVNRAALAAGVAAIMDKGWTKRAARHNTIWGKKIFSFLEENKILANKPSANFF